jgi:hypothetical protein
MAKAKDPIAGMTEAQRAYEAKRAAKAGMTLEKWIAQKQRAKKAAARTAAVAAAQPPQPKKLGLLRRVLARARSEA